ncbi:MAG: hypothetical protein KJZ86_16670 [Caldilineaceae bacterium]|nr:hypothetical protein [Caldilineaceae bacterium]HRJ41017.1 hypothetical protein [Caldilineaceae bacterium]
MPPEENSSAFIVRVWIEPREVEGAPVVWRGSIEHVGSGRVKYVTELEEIGRFVRRFLEYVGVEFVEKRELRDEHIPNIK